MWLPTKGLEVDGISSLRSTSNVVFVVIKDKAEFVHLVSSHLRPGQQRGNENFLLADACYRLEVLCVGVSQLHPSQARDFCLALDLSMAASPRSHFFKCLHNCTSSP
jgi:hypothetical protein